MNLPKNKTVLFFSPHCDDEVIAAGALLNTLSKENKVSVYYAANGPKGVAKQIPDEQKIKIRQLEAKNSCKILGISANFLNLDEVLKCKEKYQNNLKLICNILKQEKPALVITLYENDAHPSHQIVTKLVREAANKEKVSLCFGEVWTPILKPNDAFFFDNDLMNLKISALSKYRSQIKRTNWVEAIKNLNSYRAITLMEVLVGGFGSSLTPKGLYAEAFQIQ